MAQRCRRPLTSRQRFGLSLSRFVGGDYPRTVAFSHNFPAILVTAESGEARVTQSIVRRPSKNSMRATMNGSNQRHIAIFTP